MESNFQRDSYNLLGRYTEGVKLLALSMLIALYVLSVILLYRYDVVENGLYFSHGFDSQYGIPIIVITWFVVVFNIGILGDFRRIDSAYKLFSVIFTLMVVVPAFLLSDLLQDDFSSTLYIDLVVITFVLAIVSRISFIESPIRYPLTVGFYLIPLTLCFLYILYMLLLYPGELRLVDLNSVYELREQAKEVQGTAIKYLVGFLLGMAAPFCLAFGVYNKNWLFVGVAFVSYLLVYMSAGHKSALITVVLMLVVYVLAKRLSVRFILACAVLGMMLILALDLVFFDGMVAAFTFDRMMVAPASLTVFYYEYFQDQQKFLLSHSIFSAFIDNPYGVTPQEVIGSEYFSDDWANVNFIGEGFANFGRVGVYGYLAFVVFIVKLYDYLTDDLPLNVRLSLFVPVLLFLLNASPLTLMLSGGYVGLLIVLFVRKRHAEKAV